MYKNVNKRNLAHVDEIHKQFDLQTKRVPLGNISCNPEAEARLRSLSTKSSKYSTVDNYCKEFEKRSFQIYQDKENFDQNCENKVQNVYEPHKQFGFQNNEEEQLDNNHAAVTHRKTYSSVLAQGSSISTKTSKETSVFSTKTVTKSVKSKELLWCSAYTKDIFDYLQSTEVNFQPKKDYMKMQHEISMDMRTILVDWLVEVGEEFKLHTETLFLSVSYLDRFLSHMTVPKDKLQLVGISSMFLAAKYEEIYLPELSEFAMITDNTYDKKQILRMEFLLLKVLNFDLCVPTAYYFLMLYCSVSCASQEVKDFSQCICELSLLDGDRFLKFSPSIIAAGSLALANYALSFEMWSKDLIKFTGYTLSELMNVILNLRDRYISMSTCPQQAIMEKYKSSKYGCCSSMTLSEDFFSLDE